MKKIGFTLAEILITLGIVGVVAALTTPALVNSSRNEANGAKLAVVINTLENAFNNAIVKDGVQGLESTSIWGKGVSGTTPNIKFSSELGKYMVLTSYKLGGFSEYYNTVYKMADSGAQGDSVGNKINDAGDFPVSVNSITLTMKNSAVIFIMISPKEPEYEYGEKSGQRIDASEFGSAFKKRVAKVFVDVNGKAAPNTLGRDIFYFQLGSNGILYPYGGSDTSIMTDNFIDGTPATWKDEGYKFTCTDDKKGKGKEYDGLGCTARLIEENYKMNY